MFPGPDQASCGCCLAVRRILAALACLGGVGFGVVAEPDDRSLGFNPALVVDPNVAPPFVLTALPRIGPTLAGRIVSEREVRPFRSLADLDVRVKGIGPTTIAALTPHLRFDASDAPATPRGRPHSATP